MTLTTILDNTRSILLIALVILSVLFLRQCNETRNETAKRIEVERMAEQNLKAMSDSTVVLKLTRTQLATADKKLSKLVSYADSLVKEIGKKNKVMELLVVRPIANGDAVSTKNTAHKDSGALSGVGRYGLDFKFNDSVKSFKGSSYFYLQKKDSSFVVVADSTKIKDFKLNFEMVIINYDDATEKVTKYKIVPFYIDSVGVRTQLTDNQLKFSFRGVELLDKPWTSKVTSPIEPKVKTRLVGAWGLGINPLGIGPVVRNGVIKFGYTPSISLGYFLTFRKK